MSISKVNGSNGVNREVEVDSVEGNRVWLNDGSSFTAGLEPFPDESFVDSDFSFLKFLVREYSNTEEFLSDYLIYNKSLEEKFESILMKYFGGSLRRFYLYMKENTKTSYEVTAYGSVEVQDGITFDVDSSFIKVGSDGDVSLVSEEDHTGYMSQLDVAMSEQLMTGDFEMSSHHVTSVLELNRSYIGVTYEQIADHTIQELGVDVTQKHLDWIRGGMRGKIVPPTNELTESSQSSVTH